MIATNGLLAASDCTKFVSGRGSAADPAGGAYSAPPDPSWFTMDPTSEGKWRGKAGEGSEWKRPGRDETGEGTPPQTEIPGSARESCISNKN